jgi:MFS superfamily sulfate permease-like transporter
MESLINIIISSLPEAVGALLAAFIIALLAILRKKSSKIKNLESLGDDNVYSDRKYYEKMRPKLFSKSRNIKLHSIFAFLEFQNLYSLIEEALREGKSVEILISDPSSDYIKVNDPMQLALISADITPKIEKDLKLFKQIKTNIENNKWKGQFEVRLYSQHPMWSIYIFDNELFASPYLFRTEGSDTPCIHTVDKNSNRTPYGQFFRHYQKIWEQAKPYDYSKVEIKQLFK